VHIQINTDEATSGGDALAELVKAEINAHIGRFSKHISRIEVHLSDLNAGKAGNSDKRCIIEVRLEGRKPEVVTDQASTLERAYKGATKKLKLSLESTLGRINDNKSRETIRAGDL
jgi:hypothetical protein